MHNKIFKFFGQGCILGATEMISTVLLLNLLFSSHSKCPVCNDKVNGKHFGIYSCGSCSCFFRRTVQNNKQYICLAYENCIINDKISRSRCSYCRYQKCVKAGMKIEVLKPTGVPVIPTKASKIVKVDKCHICGKYFDEHALQVHIETTHPAEKTRNLEDFFYKNGLIEDTIEQNHISNVQNVPNHFMSNVQIQNNTNGLIEYTIEPNHQIANFQNVQNIQNVQIQNNTNGLIEYTIEPNHQITNVQNVQSFQNIQNVQIQNNNAFEIAGTDTIKIEPPDNLNTFDSANEKVLQVNPLEIPKVNVAEEINIKEEPVKINKTAFLHYGKNQYDQIDIKLEPLDTKEGIIQTDHFYAKDQTPNYQKFAIPGSDLKIEPIDINISDLSSRYVFTQNVNNNNFWSYTSILGKKI